MVIHRWSQQYSEKDKFMVFRDHTFEFGPDDNNLIVGWEMV